MESEVARLREQLALEYEAAQRVFTDFTPTARHQFISKRQENIEALFQELKKHLSPSEAMAIMVDVDTQVHGQGERQSHGNI